MDCDDCYFDVVAPERPSIDTRLDAEEIRATCDLLASVYEVPADVLQPIRDYADTLDKGR